MKLHDNGIADFLDISEVGIADGLVAWYPLNGDALDYTINRNDGTVNGATVAAGLDGKLAYEFDGTDDYINCGPGLDFTNNILTISAWVYIKVYAGSYRDGIVSRRASGGGWNFNTDINGRLLFMEAGAVGVTGSTIIPLEEWHHASIVAKGTSVQLYLDGVLDNVGTLTWTDVITRDICIGLGHPASNIYYHDGKIQDVRIYNRALSAEEIKILYDLTAPTLINMKEDKNTVYVRGEFQETL